MFPCTNINTIGKFVKQTALGKHGVDFRTGATRSAESVQEWTLTGTSASSGEGKVGVEYFYYCSSVKINILFTFVWDGPTLASMKEAIYLDKRTVSINNTMVD